MNTTQKPKINQTASSDMLTELLRTGAKRLIQEAVEAELQELLEHYADIKLSDGRHTVVRNGYLPERNIQTGIGDIAIKVPKVRDRSGSGVKFNSSLLPPYLKRTKSVEDLIPWLYLKGISTGDFSEALQALLGDQAQGLSPSTICKLKSKWLTEYQQWASSDLSDKAYVYWWADGIYSNVRLDDRLCLLVIIGVTTAGEKELVAVYDGYRESTASWEEVLIDLRQRGLSISPKLAIGDGSLGFWNAMAKHHPDCQHQRCWVHKTANVMEKLPKSMQAKVKDSLHQIYMADTKQKAQQAFDNTIATYQAKYPKAMYCLSKDKDELLAFYNFPAQHWQHIRTTNPIESAFATVRLRSKRSKNCGSRSTTLSMVFKLLQSAQKKWRKLRGFRLLTLVVNNVQFEDGVQVHQVTENKVAS